MIPELLRSPHLAPQRKLRNPRRAFRKILKEADGFRINPSAEDWWDLWHYHADWEGWGNRCWKYRFEYLRAEAFVFMKIAQARFHSPFQAWIYLSGEDAGQDATYLHTPNPNGSHFPCILENVDWGDERLMDVARSLLPEMTLRIGHARESGSFFIYAIDVGVPLES